MIRFFQSVCFIFLVGLVSQAYAETRTVTVDWTTSNASGITGYKMYRSYSSNMSSKKLLCQTNSSNAKSLACDNVDITKYPIYITINAVTSKGEVVSSASKVNYPNAIPSQVKGFSIN